MSKNEKRTHGTAATDVPVAEMIASEARRARTSGHVRPRPQRVQRPLSMPFPGRSIERVLRDFATPSNNTFEVNSQQVSHPLPEAKTQKINHVQGANK